MIAVSAKTRFGMPNGRGSPRPFRFRAVSHYLALIAPPGQLKVSLLGMSFMNRLQSWEVRESKLLMRGYP